MTIYDIECCEIRDRVRQSGGLQQGPVHYM